MDLFLGIAAPHVTAQKTCLYITSCSGLRALKKFSVRTARQRKGDVCLYQKMPCVRVCSTTRSWECSCTAMHHIGWWVAALQFEPTIASGCDEALQKWEGAKEINCSASHILLKKNTFRNAPGEKFSNVAHPTPGSHSFFKRRELPPASISRRT